MQHPFAGLLPIPIRSATPELENRNLEEVVAGLNKGNQPPTRAGSAMTTARSGEEGGGENGLPIGAR
jgi:hypothetical protein